MENKLENRVCKKCQQNFELDQDDFSFYEKMNVPVPEICSNCRQQQRMLFRNFKTLYKRPSSKSNKMIISMYNPDVKFPVYDIAEWWADDWDPMDYGIDLDLNKSFMEQFKELFNKVPRFSIMNTKSVNCEYSNMTIDSKNCYLVFGCVRNENCDYGHIVWDSRDCVDNLYVHKSELCYECLDCLNCNKLFYSEECESCADSIGLYDCRDCINCIGCVGLRHKSYCIFNEQVSQEEYQKFLEKYPLNEEVSIIYILNKKEELRKKIPTRPTYGYKNKNVSGDHIYEASNVKNSFDVKGGENSRYCFTSGKVIESFDISFNPNIEYGYQALNSIYSSNVIGVHGVIDSNFIYYSESCYNSQNCFGCFGLRNKKYCILNKQYSKESFDKLRTQIIENMKKSGTWGNFFPVEISPFSYNESIANEYMPLTKEEAIRQGFSWRDDIPFTVGQENCLYKDLPKNPENYQEGELLTKILKCEACDKNYRFIAREIVFYKRMKLALPAKCFNCRHQKRMNKRNPRILNKINCFKCGLETETTYRKEKHKEYKIYCEECYKKEMN
jgi:hypothetical protein